MCLGSNVTVEVKGVSDTRLFDLLRRLWIRGHRREDLRVVPADWITGFPDLMQLLGEAKNRGLIEVYPTETEDRGYRIQELTLLPSTLEHLENDTRLVHRQLTAVDGTRIDLRSMVGQVLATPNMANLADACRIWLADLRYERPCARRKVRILLERAVGIRGTELAAYDPELKAEIMKALTDPCGSGKVRESERGDT